MKGCVAVLALAATVLTQQAVADPAADLWAKGRYEDAIGKGLAEGTPEGVSVAARAALSDMIMHTTPCEACVARTEELSRKALAADPKSALPTIYFVFALGYRGRMVGLMKARAAGLAEKSKQAIDDALTIHPDNPELLATLGGWNFDVVRGGGALLARLAYGATTANGIAEYQRAFRLSPNDPLINYQYGLGLASIDADDYHDQIAIAWKRVIASPAGNAFEEMQKKRAAELLALLNGGDNRAFETRLDSYMGIPF